MYQADRSVAKLMYAAGDVAEPSMDTVDYMEDLVVEFLSDLVRYGVCSFQRRLS